MPDFSQLSKLDVKPTKIVDYEFSQLSGNYVFQVIPATEANKPFFNALLKRARKTNKAVQAGAINANMIAQNRDQDRDLYANYIVKGWKNIVDVKGVPVEFTVPNCLEFLQALPDHVFDELRAFCGNLMNFVDEESLDAETTAKN